MKRKTEDGGLRTEEGLKSSKDEELKGGLPEENGFWAILELFGHQRLAGFVSEYAFAGEMFARIDVPEAGDLKRFTRFFGGKAIYSLNPVTEEIARRLVAAWRAVPIQPFELQMPALGHEEDM